MIPPTSPTGGKHAASFILLEVLPCLELWRQAASTASPDPLLPKRLALQCLKGIISIKRSIVLYEQPAAGTGRPDIACVRACSTQRFRSLDAKRGIWFFAGIFTGSPTKKHNFCRLKIAWARHHVVNGWFFSNAHPVTGGVPVQKENSYEITERQPN